MLVPWKRIIDVALTDLTSPREKAADEAPRGETAEGQRAREQAERASRLERLRQTGAREIVRLRWVAGLSIVSWIGALVVSVLIAVSGTRARIVLGAGWIALIAAMITAVVAQLRVSEALNRIGEDTRAEDLSSGAAGALSPSLIVIGLGLVILAILI